MDEFLTTDELASYLKLSRKTVEKLRKAGKLEYIKVGTQYRYPVSQFKPEKSK